MDGPPDHRASDVPTVKARVNAINAVVEEREQDPYREDGGEG
jgi:hypothetical protein